MSGTVAPVAEVLLVEDDPAIRRALIRALGDLGHVVTAEATGISALQTIMERRPELVVLDLGLPDVDGDELLRMVRAVSQVPIVVVTARRDEATIVRILKHGADDYVIKPFGPAELDARIGAVLRRSATQRDAQEPLLIGELPSTGRPGRSRSPASGSTSRRASSTCWPISPRGSAPWCPAANC